MSCKCTLKKEKYKNLKKKIIFFRRLEGHWQKEQDADPLVKSTDRRIRIRIKMSRIPNTVC